MINTIMRKLDSLALDRVRKSELLKTLVAEEFINDREVVKLDAVDSDVYLKDVVLVSPVIRDCHIVVKTPSRNSVLDIKGSRVGVSNNLIVEKHE